VANTEQLLEAAGLIKSILVDCSHDNSAKKPERQPEVMRELLAQIGAGNASIMGAMVESNLHAGSQPLPQPPVGLRRGVSITDACIGWETTEALIREVPSGLKVRFC
jgi:3-deoxy-7-phosphoheptulonate synthase